MNTRLKAQLLPYFARKSRQPGMTLLDCLLLMVMLMILAAVALPYLLSSKHKVIEVEARNNIGAINRSQQSYHLENGKFADSLEQLQLGIQNPSNYYKYSLHTSSLAAFTYSTTSQTRSRSYLGIAIAIPSSDNSDDISTKTILCQQEEPGIPPSEPILKDGVIGCGENMEDLEYSGGGSGKIEVGKDWEVAYRAWELAREGKYDPALELAETITDDWYKDSALSAIAHELVAAGQNDRALELAQTITHHGHKASVLLAITRQLSEAGEDESALELAETIANDWYKAQAFLAIAPHLTNDTKYDRILEIASAITDDWKRTRVLKAIVPHLSSDAQYDRALEIASTITDDRKKSEALQAIVPHFTSDAQYDRALELTATMPDDWRKTWALVAIAPHLTNDAQYNRALEIAETIIDDRAKSRALEAIARAKNAQKSTTDE